MCTLDTQIKYQRFSLSGRKDKSFTKLDFKVNVEVLSKGKVKRDM